ncbi:hypothetical protein Q73_01940 [Bacillus coahuilensis m2-6]|uniref:sensor histidine kinase n=1 Tax=Bacillus coahuilensis TaxID=408580 RepID=UPI0007502AA8|nr:sensor histidine kinase [Bacillus coahuilensis]KUP09665.1 hypothetical protein Q73_01940 [Bacillus coahuilensis m2-6]
MTQNPFNLLGFSRIFMLILISLVYFTSLPSEDLPRKLFVLFAMCTFILTHFLLFNETTKHHWLIFTSLDFILATCYAFVFMGDGTLYLILFGIISVTLFLSTENTRIYLTFGILFFIMWGTVLLLDNGQNIWNHIISVSFVIFSSIVGRLIGKIEQARDKEAEQHHQLQESHSALKDAHEQLRDYARQVEELTVYRERNQMARDIHDTVGHKMTALLVQLQLAKEYHMRKQPVDSILDTCEGLTRDSLQEIRLSVRTVTVYGETSKMELFIPSIKKMLKEFAEMTGMDTHLTIRGDLTLLPTTLQPVLIRFIQEGITNAKRHGNATTCSITLTSISTEVRLIIEDNGSGTSNVTPGFGLLNMKERALEHGGSVLFKSESQKGFQVEASFPLSEMKWSVKSS